MIETSETRFPDHAYLGAAAVFYALRKEGGPPPVLPQSQAVGVALPVFVNQSRWMVICPSCNSAQWASKSDRRFFCFHCRNADHGGQWVAVAWPSDPDVADIETILDVRPDAYSRSWNMPERPPETVADLIVENDQHNIGVPDDVRKRHA